MPRGRPMGYRSRAARRGALLSAALFRGAPRRRPTDDPQSAIRAALRRRRRALGLTQAEAAQMLGLPRLAYHRIEAGRRRIGFAEMAAICGAFGCHVGELVEDGQLAHAFARAAQVLLGQGPS
jgi:DNA-binding XRE family transcriptional regulator